MEKFQLYSSIKKRKIINTKASNERKNVTNYTIGYKMTVSP